MIKALVKLAIVALLANAAVRVGSEYLNYVKFRDAIRDAAMFKTKTDPDLLARIMQLAEQYDIPLEADHVLIEREDRMVNVSGSYDKPIELLPNRTYPWHFSLTLDVVSPAMLPPLP
ncbi:MAG: hypothetical protein AB7Q29_15805 [Vicinamibacterales bacterium]